MAQRTIGVKGECRYDFVVEGIEALQAYMDTCASEDNTNALIENAKSAVLELEKIEKGINTRISKDKNKETMTSAMKELRSKLDKLAPEMEKVGKFVADHKKAIDAVASMTRSMNNLMLISGALKNLNTAIERRIATVERKAGFTGANNGS